MKKKTSCYQQFVPDVAHGLKIVDAKMEPMDVSRVLSRYTTTIRLLDGQLAVRIGYGRYDCLPDDASAVFKPCHASGKSVALPDSHGLQWPDDYCVALYIRSVEVDEMLDIVKHASADDVRLVSLPPFGDRRSIAVGDIAAVNRTAFGSRFIDVKRYNSPGWTLVERISDF